MLIEPDAHEIRARPGKRFPRRAEPALRIAMLAPPWFPVPPLGYGGIEQVVSLLSDELVRRGHAVTLFAPPGSRSAATLRTPLSRAHPEHIGQSLYEADHVARALAEVDAARADGEPFDVIHDHCGFTTIAMADRLATPMVHTIHGTFSNDTAAFYAEHGRHAVTVTVAISRTQLAEAPPALRGSPVIPNPIAVGRWPLREHKDDYLLWVGRMDEVKGPHRAIEVARRSGRRLVLAGPIQPGQKAFFASEVEPRLDGRFQYVGEVGGRRKVELFARASALLMPITWSEPFGMVMVEALACGTPVIAFPRGAATEIVVDGENGALVADVPEMARAVKGIDRIDASRCRASVDSRYDVGAVAAAYEQVYVEQAGLSRAAQPRIPELQALTAA